MADDNEIEVQGLELETSEDGGQVILADAIKEAINEHVEGVAELFFDRLVEQRLEQRFRDIESVLVSPDKVVNAPRPVYDEPPSYVPEEEDDGEWYRPPGSL